MTDCLSPRSSDDAPSESLPFAAPPEKRVTAQTLRRQAADALYGLGNGRFQFIAAFVLGIANCSDAVEVCLPVACAVSIPLRTSAPRDTFPPIPLQLLAISFILPNISATPGDKVFLSAGVFVGMLLGGLCGMLVGREMPLLLVPPSRALRPRSWARRRLAQIRA